VFALLLAYNTCASNVMHEASRDVSSSDFDAVLYRYSSTASSVLLGSLRTLFCSAILMRRNVLRGS
jgi:hypothetical protein